MENTHLSFLTALGGKLSGEKVAGVSPIAKTGEAATDRNGFFAILNRLLTAGGGENAEEGDAPQTLLQIKPSEDRNLTSDLPVALTTEPVEGVPDVTLGDGVAAPINGAGDEQAFDIAGLAVVAPGENIITANPEAAVSERVETIGAPKFAAPNGKGVAALTPGAAQGAKTNSTPAELSPEVNAELSVDAQGKGADAGERPVMNLGQSQAKPSLTAPQLPQAAQKTLPETAQAENAILSAGVDGETPAVERSAVTRLEATSVASDKTLSINPVRDQIVAAVVARSNEGRLEVQLDPPELGRVTINFEADGADIVRAVISADTPETLDLMRRNADAFQRALEEQGFEGLDLQFAESGAENAEGDEPEKANRFALSDDTDVSGLLREDDESAQGVALGRLDRRF